MDGTELLKEKIYLVIFHIEYKYIFTLGKFWPADIHTKGTRPTTAIKHVHYQTRNVCVPIVRTVKSPQR